MDLLEEYYRCFNENPFAEATREKDKELMALSGNGRNGKSTGLVEDWIWQEIIGSTDDGTLNLLQKGAGYEL